MGDASSCTRRKGSAVSAKASYRDRSSLLGTLSVLPALEKLELVKSSARAGPDPRRRSGHCVACRFSLDL